MSRIIKKYTWQGDVTLNVIKGKWKCIILYHLLNDEVLRFGELKKRLERVSVKVLSQSLKEMELDGLENKKVYAEIPPHTDYIITGLGRSLPRP